MVVASNEHEQTDVEQTPVVPESAKWRRLGFPVLLVLAFLVALGWNATTVDDAPPVQHQSSAQSFEWSTFAEDIHAKSSILSESTSYSDDPTEQAKKEKKEATSHQNSPRTLTIAGTGDILIHSSVYRQASHYAVGSDREYDFRPMFEQVRPIFETVDLAICHLEVPISPDNTELSGFPLFNAPRELADDLAWAGFDACSTASNHTMDQGMEGVEATHDALDLAGVAHAGGNRTRVEANTPRLYQAGDVIVGHISATFSLNGLPRPDPWVVDLLDDDRFEERAEAARDAGADLVVASLHWGHEYVAEPNHRQRQLGKRLLSEGIADVILGHHAHVIQPITEIDGKPLVYGQGNFLSNQSAACCPPETQDGMIPIIELRESDDGWDADIFVIPTWVDRSDFTIVDIGRSLHDLDYRHRYRHLEISRQRTRNAVGDLPDIIHGAEIEAATMPTWLATR